MAAFRFYQAQIDGLCVVSRGMAYEYNGTSYEYLTGIGLESGGLVYGLADFWKYADNPQTIYWQNVDTIPKSTTYLQTESGIVIDTEDGEPIYVGN